MDDYDGELFIEWTGAENQTFMYTGIWSSSPTAFYPNSLTEGTLDDVLAAIRKPRSEDPQKQGYVFWPKNVSAEGQKVTIYTQEYIYPNPFVYNIKARVFAKFAIDEKVVGVINNYPDYLIQTESKVLSLLNRPNINDDTDTYTGKIITRPMKLENALALKSIMQIRHVLQMQGAMSLHIFASNNLDNWAELHSLRGTPWKYYRFQYDFSNLKATDRFAGTMLITQERRTNKLR
jgi:hypothetical protein